MWKKKKMLFPCMKSVVNSTGVNVQMFLHQRYKNQSDFPYFHSSVVGSIVNNVIECWPLIFHQEGNMWLSPSLCTRLIKVLNLIINPHRTWTGIFDYYCSNTFLVCNLWVEIVSFIRNLQSSVKNVPHLKWGVVSRSLSLHPVASSATEKHLWIK